MYQHPALITSFRLGDLYEVAHGFYSCPGDPADPTTESPSGDTDNDCGVP